MDDAKQFYVNLAEKMEQLTESQKKVADYIIRNGKDVAFLTAQDLSEKVGVSLATVVRTASSLGYTSYQNLREIISKLVMNSYSPTWQELEESWQNPDANDLLGMVVRSNIESLRCILTDDVNNSVHNAIDILNKSDKIYVLGSRSSRAPALYFYYSLQQFKWNSYVLGTMGVDDLYENLLRIDNSSTIFAISNGYPHYSTQTIDAVKFASKKCVPVVLITDNMSNPAIPFCKEVIKVSGCGSHFSIVPLMTIIDAIIVGMGRSKPEESISKLRLLWKTLIENHITADY
jgi:DNA-binding MurR/RpiR family transcriptional regulator